MKDIKDKFTKYQNVVFLQDSEADEALNIFSRQGVEQAINHLAQWDYGEGEIMDSEPYGTDDDVYQRGDYLLSVNTRIGYIGLCAGIKG